MATVVNARDVLLQATAPRVATTNASPNLVVDPSQVTGLGLIIEGTKLVTLSATAQQFQVAKSGTVSPSFTTLTPVFRNITGAAVVSVTMGTISPAPVYVGGVITINYTDLVTDAATIRVSVLDANGTTYYDDMTIIKVREGNDALNGYLTNETVTLPADYLGNVLNYAGASGTFKVLQGNNDVTAACTFTVVSNPSGLTFTLNPTTGAYVLNGGYGAGTDVTSVTMRATLDITTGPDPTVDKVFTIAKSKAGANGTSGSRGSRTFYVTLTGATAEWSDATATAVCGGSGAVILNDTVTQSNDSAKFSQTRFWDGGTWAVVNAVIDGNLLVSGTIGASKIAVNDLTAIQASLGTATINANGYLRGGAASYLTGNGFYLGYESGAYRFRVGNMGGAMINWDGTNLDITGNATFSGSLTSATGSFLGGVYGGAYTPVLGYAWPAAGAGGGFHLSSAGLLIGNANAPGSQYFQVTSAGAFYAPGLVSAGGALTISGTMSAGAISVGNGSMTFYDPAQGTNWEIRTSAQSSLFGIYVDAGYYDATYGTYFPTIITDTDKLRFTTGYSATPLNRRLRVGVVRFSIVATAMIDEHFTLWWRTQGGAWAPLVTIDETQTSYGTGALCYSFDVSCYNGLILDFGVSSGNMDTTSYGTYGLFADPGKRNIQHGAVTVTAVNF